MNLSTNHEQETICQSDPLRALGEDTVLGTDSIAPDYTTPELFRVLTTDRIYYNGNGEKKTRIVEKCNLVKTHTARRSGATNMYLAGIPTIAIMKITGHKTEKEFMKYIKITEEESAMELMNHPYFSGKE